MSKTHVIFFLSLVLMVSQGHSADIIYKVVHKNHLSGIAKKFYDSGNCWDVIFKANPHLENPNKIFPGRELLIPDVDECKVKTENEFVKEFAQQRGEKNKGTISFKIFKMSEDVKNQKENSKERVIKINEKQADRLGEALDYYRKGLYPNAYEVLKVWKFPKEMSPIVYYWRGLCLAKMQRYDQAIKNLVSAKEGGVKAPDIDYEIGQAYYSSISYDKAVGYFKASIVKGYKVLLSTYHIAFIHQLLDEYKKSESYYLKLSNENSVSNKLEQIAIFEAAQMHYEQVRDLKEVKQIVKNKIVPQMEDAMEVDDSTSYFVKITARLHQLKDKYDLHPKPIVLANGRKLPRKRWRLKVSQSTGQDSNVLFEADGAAQVSQNKSSLFTRGTLSGSYTLVPLKSNRMTLTPSVRLTKIHHWERDIASIKENDAQTYKGNLEATYEAKISNKAISFSYGGGYEYTAKDIDGNENIREYGTGTSYWLGTRGKVFGKGNSSAKLKMRNFKGYRSGLDSDKVSVIFSHFFPFSKSRYLYTYSDFTFTDSNLNSSTTDKYLFSADHVLTNFYKKISLWTSASFGFVNPKLQKISRGMEKEISMTLKVSRTFFTNVDFGLKFNYFKNISKDKTLHQYTKNTTSLDLSYKF